MRQEHLLLSSLLLHFPRPVSDVCFALQEDPRETAPVVAVGNEPAGGEEDGSGPSAIWSEDTNEHLET